MVPVKCLAYCRKLKKCVCDIGWLQAKWEVENENRVENRRHFPLPCQEVLRIALWLAKLGNIFF